MNTRINSRKWIGLIQKFGEFLTPEQKNELKSSKPKENSRNNNNMFQKNDTRKKPGINSTQYGKQYDKDDKKKSSQSDHKVQFKVTDVEDTTTGVWQASICPKKQLY